VGFSGSPRIIFVYEYYLKTSYDLPLQAGSFFTVMFGHVAGDRFF
jgi:hypothetical protein